MLKTTRAQKLWSKRNVPEELWPEILSRLPVKSLLRFRSVSRSWKAMIDDPQFARLHFNRFNNRHESHLLFIQGSSSECVVKNSTTLRTNSRLGFLQSDLESAHVLRTTPARIGDFKSWSIVSSIDGLFLLNCEKSSDLMLWNPSIRKTLALPSPPEISAESKAVNFGLGFDPSIRDYKAVRFVLIPENGVQSVAIYTLGTDSWKKVEFRGEFRQDMMFTYDQRSTPFDGALYALAQENRLSPLKLVSFDLSTEMLASIELPNVRHNFHQALTMVDDGSSLALVNVSNPIGSVWALARLGDDVKSWSWVQLYTFATQILDEGICTWKLRFLCLKKNGEMLLKWHYKVICYDLETQQKKILLEKNKTRLYEESAFPHIESLFLLRRYCFGKEGKPYKVPCKLGESLG